MTVGGDKRSRGGRPFRKVAVCSSTLLLLAVMGCDLAQSLEDVGSSLTNPDAGLLDTPGRKLVSGKYYRLLVDGSLEEGGHVIALQATDDGTQAKVIPYPEGKSCTIAPAIGFERLSSRVDVALPGILSVQHTSDDVGRGEVSFVDFNCESVIDSLSDTTLPQFGFPALQPEGLLALTGSGMLYQVNPIDQLLEPIAEDVSVARTEVDTIWTIEGGELVLRGPNFSELERMGTGVTEFVITGGSSIKVAFIDEVGLHTFGQDEGVTHLSSTACAVVSLGLDTIAYFDPCETSHMRVYTQGARLGLSDDFVFIDGPDGTVRLDKSVVTWAQGSRDSEILFLTSGENGNQLHLGTIAADVEATDGIVTLETSVLSDENADLVSGYVYTDFNGLSGTLMERERDEEGQTVGLYPVAPRVAQMLGTLYSNAGVLTNFDGMVGDLEVIQNHEGDISTDLIAAGVPLQSHTVEEETFRRAFIADSEDGVIGNLYLTNEPGNNGENPTVVKKVGEYAHVETARFLEQPRGVAYLARKPGDEFATLKVWLIDSELTLTIHDRVSEYRTVPWPSPGILYAVPSGDDAGLWFSKAR